MEKFTPRKSNEEPEKDNSRRGFLKKIGLLAAGTLVFGPIGPSDKKI